MKVVAFVTQAKTVTAILTSLGLPPSQHDPSAPGVIPEFPVAE
jgi:hypothetical protein